jgi:uncharacterized membrane protein
VAPLGMLVMLLIWGGAVGLAILGVRLLFPWQTLPRKRSTSQLLAGEILDQRYAGGELTREQYEVLKGSLEKRE